MINQARKELLKALEEVCDRYPHWRFGQVVANVAGMADVDIWDVEDDQLKEAARNHLHSGSKAQAVNDPMLDSPA